MDGPVLVEKLSCRMLGLCFYSKLHWDSYIFSIAKTASNKIGVLIFSMKFILKLLFISINLPHSLDWNNDVLPGLVFLVVTWIC